MKKTHVLPALFISIFLLILSIGCKKGITDPVNLDKAAGKWSINAIRMKVYYGDVLYKDSTTPWNPVVENFINFDGISSVKYCFNSAEISNGSYKMLPGDSLFLNVKEEAANWKILLLTPTNFNIERTLLNHNDFPGAKVLLYQCFVH